MFRITKYRIAAFTLVEILVVIAIIALLAAILFAVLFGALKTGRKAKCISHQRQIAESLLIYAQENDDQLPSAESIWKEIALPPKLLRCPASPGLSNGYLYNHRLSDRSLSLMKYPEKTFLTTDGRDGQPDLRHHENLVVAYTDGHVALRKNTLDAICIVFNHRNCQAERQNICIMDANGNEHVPLASVSTGIGIQPIISPQGDRIAYWDRMGDKIGGYKSGIFLFDIDGSHPTQVKTDSLRFAVNPAFSPDGKRIAFVSSPKSTFGDVYEVDVTGENLTRLTWLPTWQRACTVSYRPDGKKMALTIIDDKTHILKIFIIDRDGSHLQCLSSDDASEGRDAGPSFSPDGKKILFTSSIKGSLKEKIFNICLMNCDGSDRQVLYSGQPSEALGFTSFTPDGTHIIFSANKLLNHEPFTGNIYIMQADGTKVRQLTDDGKSAYPSCAFYGGGG